jgi:hypothetical protein
MPCRNCTTNRKGQHKEIKIQVRVYKAPSEQREQDSTEDEKTQPTASRAAHLGNESRTKRHSSSKGKRYIK